MLRALLLTCVRSWMSTEEANGITLRCRFNKRVQVRQQGHILVDGCLPATPWLPHPIRAQSCTRLHFPDAAHNRGTRDTGRSLDESDAAVPKCKRFCCRPKPSRPFRQSGRERCEFALQGRDIHTLTLGQSETERQSVII